MGPATAAELSSQEFRVWTKYGKMSRALVVSPCDLFFVLTIKKLFDLRNSFCYWHV